jgi:hypothetical protein
VHQSHLDQEIEAAIDARRRDGGVLWPHAIKQLVGSHWSTSPQQLAQYRTALPREPPTARAADRFRFIKPSHPIPSVRHPGLLARRRQA